MALGLHSLQSSQKKTRKRAGRGNSGPKGNYSGRGLKGQRARSGGKSSGKHAGKKVPKFILQLPKKKGFTSRIEKAEVVNVSDLAKVKEEKITITQLKKVGLIKKGARVKVLGNGKITRKVTIDVHEVSESAKQKIEKAGGKVNILS